MWLVRRGGCSCYSCQSDSFGFDEGGHKYVKEAVGDEGSILVQKGEKVVFDHFKDVVFEAWVAGDAGRVAGSLTLLRRDPVGQALHGRQGPRGQVVL